MIYNSYLGSFEISHDDNFIYFQNLGTGVTKPVKVLKNSESIIKGNKRSISGKGGASGVFEFFKDAIEKDFLTSYIDKTIKDYVLQ